MQRGHRVPAKPSKPFIVPVFLPNAGCDHRCVFCNQRAVTGVDGAVFDPGALDRTIDRFLAYKGPNRHPVQVSFYGGNFLGLGKEKIRACLDAAQRFIAAGRVDTIRFSTRPDTITVERLALLQGYRVATIEIGVQSMNDRILQLCERGHTADDTRQAATLAKSMGYAVGLQMMVGLPGENPNDALDTAAEIAQLAPDFVRIYPTVVLRKSRLARWYRQGRYVPMSLEGCVARVKQIYLFFARRQIPVIRMGLQSSGQTASDAGIVAGPFHPAFGHLVQCEIFLDRAAVLLSEMKKPLAAVRFRVHPPSVPRLRGLRNANIDTLRRRFGIGTVHVVPDPSLTAEHPLAVDG